ncbi:MAG: TetR/AcrR family transcriptional regulator [Hyphomicrobiaceae bacterium]|nr:TetR/AcrR family transcriptional regulator [Hyphomicrobiaceae bacterium]
MATEKQRQKIISAFMAELATNRWQAIGLDRIADAAGLSLAQLRGAYADKAAIIADFAARIDQAVLDGHDPNMAGEPVKDRLFDVLMRRFDALAPHKVAIKGLVASVRRDPALALMLNRVAVGSQRWMLAAAGLDHSGLEGRIRAQALALAFAHVLETWIDDDAEGWPKTLAELDRVLARLDRLARVAEQLRGFLAPLKARVDDACARRRADAAPPPPADAPPPETTAASIH